MGASDIPPVDCDHTPFPHLRDISFGRAPGGVGMIIGAGHAETWVGGETRSGPLGGAYGHIDPARMDPLENIGKGPPRKGLP